MNNSEKYEENYNKLTAIGRAIYYGFICELKEHEAIIGSYKKLSKKLLELGEENLFSLTYHRWYNECLRLIKQLIPERLDDFVGYPQQKNKSQQRKILRT